MKLFGKFLVLFAVMMACISVMAEAWEYHGPKRDIVTLIVCANYEQPRLLAELIQVESRQPYLLIPANDNGDIYFCPPTKLGKSKVIPRKSFSRTISFINPKQIIVLGNNNYVPENYVAALRKIAPVFVIDTETWQAAADSIAPMLNLSKLPRNYRKLSAQLAEGKFYIPDPRLVNKNTNAKVLDNESVESDTPELVVEEDSKEDEDTPEITEENDALIDEK
jgi:hypothetical protein